MSVVQFRSQHRCTLCSRSTRWKLIKQKLLYFTVKESNLPSVRQRRSIAEPPGQPDLFPQRVPKPFLSAGNFNHATAYCERFHSQTLTAASFSSVTEFILTSHFWGLRKTLALCDKQSRISCLLYTFQIIAEKMEGTNRFPAGWIFSGGHSQNCRAVLGAPFPGSSWLSLASVLEAQAFGACKCGLLSERLC